MTMDNANLPSEPIDVAHPTLPSHEEEVRQRNILIGIIVGVVVLLILFLGSLYYLLTAPLLDVTRIRDIMIIFMAFLSFLLGLTMVILIIQMARLINLLQNEIKPILDSTNETVSNLRGTTTFLSDNLVEPVMKLNEYTAGLSQLLMTIGLVRRRPKL